MDWKRFRREHPMRKIGGVAQMVHECGVEPATPSPVHHVGHNGRYKTKWRPAPPTLTEREKELNNRNRRAA